MKIVTTSPGLPYYCIEFVSNHARSALVYFTEKGAIKILDKLIFTLGALQRKNSQNLSLLWKWVGGPGLTRIFLFFGKSFQNNSKPGAKTINVFRACLGAQLPICAQK